MLAGIFSIAFLPDALAALAGICTFTKTLHIAVVSSY